VVNGLDDGGDVEKMSLTESSTSVVSFTSNPIYLYDSAPVTMLHFKMNKVRQ
jgi:hypothetical protein